MGWGELREEMGGTDRLRREPSETVTESKREKERSGGTARSR